MSQAHLHDQDWNPWKFVAIGMALVFATALITGVVVANYVGNSKGSPATPEQSVVEQPGAAGPPPVPAQAAVPPPPPPAHEAAPAAAPPAPPAARRAGAEPSTAEIAACNRYASSVSRGKTETTLTDALVGGALGAGLGAAGGAIAGGGGGAGKGAGIGALVGAAGGTLYGLNDSNRSDARAAEAYRSCMRQHGYSD